MHKTRANVYATVIIAILAAAALAAQPAVPPSVFFVANEGQWDEPFAFKLSTGGTTVWVTEEGLTLDIRQHERTASLSRGGRPDGLDALDPMERDREPEPVSVRGHVLKMNFVSANPHPQLVGQDKLASYSNYFLGRDSCKWRSRVGHYQRVIAENVWQGIDVEFVADAHGVKTNYHVHPGAEVSQIQIEYEGLDAPLRVDGSGNLVLATSMGDLKEQAPWAYQIDGRHQRDVGVQFAVLDEHRYGVLASSVDASKELVIDPLIYSTYLGGEFRDFVRRCAVDSMGHPVMIGGSGSSEFPTTPGAYQEDWRGGWDAYISKFTVNGDSLMYSTYLGGTRSEHIEDGDAFPDGSAFVVGWYESSGDWPLTPNAVDSVFAGPRESFIGYVSADGTQLLFSSYLGGISVDIAAACSAFPDGNLYVTGWTHSSDFPVTSDALYPDYVTVVNGFLTVIDPRAGEVAYSTYFPYTQIGAISLTPSGHLWFLGGAGDTLAVTPGAFSTEFPNDGSNYFFGELDVANSELLYLSYLPGIAYYPKLVANPSDERVYLAGHSDSVGMPCSATAFDTVGPGPYLLCIDLPNTLTYATYLQGLNVVQFLMEADSSLVIVGNTDTTFAITDNAYDSTFWCWWGPPYSEGILCKLSADFSRVEYASYAGGSWVEGLETVCRRETGVYWTGGFTQSSDFPVTADAFQSRLSGEGNAVMMRWDLRDLNSTPERTSPAEISAVSLLAYPNPFNATTTLRLSLTQPGMTTLRVSDITGRLVSTVTAHWLPAGTHDVVFDGNSLASGVYFVSLSCESGRLTHRLVLLR